MNKHYTYINKIINKAKDERDKKGYRENLGYDQYSKVRDYLSRQRLDYSDESKLMNYFHEQCNLI